jgi:tetratricopeptide (TPR) repeat protein
MRYILLILFLLAFVCQKSSAQTLEDKIKLGLDYTYNVKFDSAKVIFDEIIKAEPRNPRGYFLLALVEWWKININKEDESNDENFYKAVEKVEEVADEVLDKNENDDNAMFYKGGAIGLRGLLRSVRVSWLRAAEDGRKALNLLQRSIEVNPNNKDGLFGIGVYNYFAEYVPDR